MLKDLHFRQLTMIKYAALGIKLLILNFPAADVLDVHFGFPTATVIPTSPILLWLGLSGNPRARNWPLGTDRPAMIAFNEAGSGGLGGSTGQSKARLRTISVPERGNLHEMALEWVYQAEHRCKSGWVPAGASFQPFLGLEKTEQRPKKVEIWPR